MDPLAFAGVGDLRTGGWHGFEQKSSGKGLGFGREGAHLKTDTQHKQTAVSNFTSRKKLNFRTPAGSADGGRFARRLSNDQSRPDDLTCSKESRFTARLSDGNAGCRTKKEEHTLFTRPFGDVCCTHSESELFVCALGSHWGSHSAITPFFT